MSENELVNEENGLFDVKSHEILPKMYLSYALSVIKDRSLPDIRDGLKPVARRILFSMHEMGLTHSKQTRKSARVVGDVMGKYHPHGDCLRGSTLVYSLNGAKYQIKDLVGKQLWVLAYDKETNKPIPVLAHSFRIGQYTNKIYRINFINGMYIEVTSNHQLCDINNNWKKASDIKECDIIANGIITNNEYPKFRSSNDFMSFGKKLHQIVGKHIYGEAEIFHHKDKNTKNNLPDNLEPLTKVAHEKIHKNYEVGLRKGNETMFHSTEEFREATMKKNSEIIKAVNQKHYLFKAIKIVKMIIDDGLEPTEGLYSTYRTKLYNGTTLERLYENGHTFEEVVEYAKSKEKLKLIDTSLAKGHTIGLKIEEDDFDNKIDERNVDAIFLHNTSHVVVQCIEDYGLDFSIADYEDTRCDLCEMEGEGYGDINNRRFTKFETLKSHFNIKSIKDLLDLLSQKHLMIVKSVEIINVDHEPMYDFTVDIFENMYVPIGINKDNSLMLILAHNSSIYGTAVRLAQPFTTRYPTIIGQGNFGSVEDPPAAMRYTEMKLSSISEEVLADIDKETVDFMPNFDGTMIEPKVLPTKIPLFLVNGSIGIAVGMATSSAPHNLTEVINALLAFIDNEDVTVSELMNHIKGPDFPSAAYMFDSNIESIYETGRGSVVLRAKADIVENNKRQCIIITELPFQVDKSKLIARIAALYKEKKLEGIDGITDIRDESDKSGTRIVIELCKGLQGKTVLNTLYRRTELQSKYSISMRALVNNIPQMVNLKQIFWYFLEHRKNVVIRRTEYELSVAEKKAHILKGYLIAFENMDKLLEDVKKSTSNEETYDKLRAYGLSDEQIKAILDLRIQRLARFERSSIEEEHSKVCNLIDDHKRLLDSEELVISKIKEELIDIRTRFGDARRTTIIKTKLCGDDEIGKIDEIEEIQEEDVVVTVTNKGLVKRTPISEYRLQNIRGKGLIGVDVKNDDYVASIFQLSTRDFTLVFTDKGNCYRMNAYDIPSLGRTAAGSSIFNILHLTDDEKVVKVVPTSDLVGKFFIMVTKQGKVKKLKGEKLRKPRAKGTKAIGLSDGDVLIDVKLMDKADDEILLVTRNGMAIRFNENTVRASGRSGAGVRGIRLQENDSIISVNIVRPENNENSFLMVVTEKGYAKRTVLRKFRVQRRGGRGLICMGVSVSVGKIISANIVSDDKEQFIVMTIRGILIRLRSAQIRKLGRNTQGSRIQKLQSDDAIAAIAYLGIVDETELQTSLDGRAIVDETAEDDNSEITDDKEDEIIEDDDNEEIEEDEESESEDNDEE